MSEMSDGDKVRDGLRALANAVTPLDASPGNDGRGGVVGSLTEGTMSMANALNRIADAISDLADAVREASEGGS